MIMWLLHYKFINEHIIKITIIKLEKYLKNTFEKKKFQHHFPLGIWNMNHIFLGNPFDMSCDIHTANTVPFAHTAIYYMIGYWLFIIWLLTLGAGHHFYGHIIVWEKQLRSWKYTHSGLFLLLTYLPAFMQEPCICLYTWITETSEAHLIGKALHIFIHIFAGINNLMVHRLQWWSVFETFKL